MSRSPARLEDLQWLSDHLSALPWDNRDERDRIARLDDWMSVMIDTRVARLTQPEPAHHKIMMEAFNAALTLHKATRERVASDYPGDLEIFDAENPAPTMKSFMIDQRRRAETAQACSCPLVVDHRPDCPLRPPCACGCEAHGDHSACTDKCYAYACERA
jgi:hypothetical protein